MERPRTAEVVLSGKPSVDAMRLIDWLANRAASDGHQVSGPVASSINGASMVTMRWKNPADGLERSLSVTVPEAANTDRLGPVATVAWQALGGRFGKGRLRGFTQGVECVGVEGMKESVLKAYSAASTAKMGNLRPVSRRTEPVARVYSTEGYLQAPLRDK